jgi:hypothetical protein
VAQIGCRDEFSYFLPGSYCIKEICTKLFPIMCNSCVTNHVKNENEGADLKKDIQEKRGGSIRLFNLTNV